MFKQFFEKKLPYKDDLKLFFTRQKHDTLLFHAIHLIDDVTENHHLCCCYQFTVEHVNDIIFRLFKDFISTFSWQDIYLIFFLPFQKLLCITVYTTIYTHDIYIGRPRGDNIGLQILILNTGG